MFIIIIGAIAICSCFHIVENDAENGCIDTFEEFACANEQRKRCFIGASNHGHAVDVLRNDECIADDSDGWRIDNNKIIFFTKFIEQDFEIIVLEQLSRGLWYFSAWD